MRLMNLCLLLSVFLSAKFVASINAEEGAVRKSSPPDKIVSTWDDLLEGVNSPESWVEHKKILKKRYLELIRDQYKPPKPDLEIQFHDTVIVDGVYRRQLISYQVEEDERAHAYLGVPLNLRGPVPAVVALHGTYASGKERAAGLIENPDKAYLDHLCRKGYVVIAPDHFVAGHRIPEEGPYDTSAFYKKHPNWTAVGKFTYEHSIAIDVLQSLREVNPEKIGVLGHSLGGHGSMFLAAYDDRVQAAVGNCSASFFRQNSKVDAWARDHWYIYFKHIRPGILEGELPPIDFHEIMALIAPRAFLDLSGLNDGNPQTQRQRILMLLKVMDVYELEKVPQNFAFFVHGKGHSVAHESRELIYGWMDSNLKPKSATKTKRVTP